MFTISKYTSLVILLTFVFGLVFELPLLVLALSVVGIVNPRMLLRTWRFAVIAIAVVSG